MPTPGHQCRQRLLTLMLEEDIAAPSWPVDSSHAAIDKVIDWVHSKKKSVGSRKRFDMRIQITLFRLTKDNTTAIAVIAGLAHTLRKLLLIH
jgi:hypothetical protein